MKKIILSTTALGILLGTLNSGDISAQSKQAAEQSQISPDKVETMAVPFWVSAAFKILYKAAGTASTYVFASNPTVVDYGNSTHIESGTIHFNVGNYEGAAQKSLVFDQYVGQQAIIWATTSPLQGGNILIRVFPQGSTQNVLNKVASSRQLITFAPKAKGNYVVDWSTSAKNVGWNLQLTYYHKPTTGGPQPYSLPENTEQVGDNFYKIPSENHKQQTMRAFSAQDEYSLEQLYAQLYDSELEDFVYQFSSLNVDQEIVFNDKISNIEYDAEKDVTNFTFNSENYGSVTWPFTGNITNEFSAGDNIKFKFKVMKTDGKYEILDYIDRLNKNEKVNINDFLLK